MSRFLEVYRFELQLHLRRPLTWISFVLLAAIAALVVLAMGNDMGVHVNAPSSVVLYTFIAGLFGMLVTAALFAEAGSRDAMTRMAPLFYTTPLRKLEYLAGRYLGAFTVNALVLLAVPLGLMLAMLAPAYDPKMVGPFAPGSYVRAYLYFLLPGLLVNSAILYTIAALTRRTLTTWLGVVGIYLAYGAAVAVTAEVLRGGHGVLLDPSGVVAVLDLLRRATPLERNTMVVLLEGPLLLNRIVWSAIGMAVLALTWVRFRMAHDAPRARRTREPDGEPERAGVVHLAPARPLQAPRAFGPAAHARQTAAVAGRSFRDIVGGREFLVVIAILMLYAIGVGMDGGSDLFGTPTRPITGAVAGFLASNLFAIPLAMIAIFYAGELVWRERDVRLADMTDATPLAHWPPIAGKVAGLCGALAVAQAALLAAGIVLQLLQGHRPVEPGLHVQILFGLALVDLWLFAVAAVLIHVVVNQKLLGHLVGVLFLMATLFHAMLGVRHNLLVFAGDAGWTWSDIARFGASLAPYAWMKAYWIGWGVMLGLLAGIFLVRGREEGARHRLRTARARVTPRLLLAATPALLLLLVTGGFVFYNTNVLTDYSTPERAYAQRAEYERRYRRLEERAQPKIAHVELRVELFPAGRRAEATGRYVLVNRSGTPVDTLVIHQRGPLQLDSLRLDRPSRLVAADARHWTWVSALDRPLPPGDSLQLEFRLSYRPRGFPNEGQPTAVLENGTYLDREDFPLIGYQRAIEVDDPARRRAAGLGPRGSPPAASDSAALHRAGSSGDADRITFDAVVGTAGDQVPASAGVLQRTWMEGGRRHAHFRSPFPTANTWAFLSARYAVRESVREGVRVQVLHHPGHHWNVGRFLDGAARALAYYTRAFGPNPFREVRFVEFPRHATRASAYPHLVTVSESFGFLSRIDEAEGHLDTPSLVAAHELAHLWWGGQVMPASVEGRQVLTETLANYSTLLVLNDTYGRDAVERFLRIQMIEYLNRRGRGDQPLLTSWDHENVHYRKGAVVMWTLREYLGEASVNAALRSLVSRFGDAGPPYPTTHDLVAGLRAVTPDSLGWLLTDLVETITIWDLHTSVARAVPLGGGRHRVTLEVAAAKFRVDSLGVHTPVPMNDQVKIAVYGDSGAAAPLYARLHRLATGTHVLTIDVQGVPRRAGIDPEHRLIARRGDDLSDNARDVEIVAP